MTLSSLFRQNQKKYTPSKTANLKRFVNRPFALYIIEVYFHVQRSSVKLSLESWFLFIASSFYIIFKLSLK